MAERFSAVMFSSMNSFGSACPDFLSGPFIPSTAQKPLHKPSPGSPRPNGVGRADNIVWQLFGRISFFSQIKLPQQTRATDKG